MAFGLFLTGDSTIISVSFMSAGFRFAIVVLALLVGICVAIPSLKISNYINFLITCRHLVFHCRSYNPISIWLAISRSFTVSRSCFFFEVQIQPCY